MPSHSEIVRFIRQLYKQADGQIPLHAPVFRGHEKEYIAECIESTFVSSVGKFVTEFEEQMAAYTGVKRAVACVNGTNAIHLALRLVGVEKGTEVITQPLTFIATANAIAYCDAAPIFVDVDRDTLGLSPGALLHFLETTTYADQSSGRTINAVTGKPISACIPMHTFGHPGRIDEIIAICDRYKIPVIEDAAESLGSFYKGRHTGTYGKIGVVSFNGNKILTTGGGGMLLFMDEELGRMAKHLSTQAKIPHPWAFVHDEIGYNYRMPNLNAALGVAQLEQLPKFLRSKRDLAARYKEFFSATEYQFVDEPSGAVSNYWLNAIICKTQNERDAVLEYTNANGIMTRPAWQLMNRLDMYAHCYCADIPNAKWLESRLINIPSSVI